MRKFARFILAMMIVTLIIGVVGAQDEYKVLRGMLSYTELPTMDPAVANDQPSIQVLNMTYIGLTNLESTTYATTPGIASSWDVVENDDGTATYTFHMFEGISWVRYDTDAGAVVQITDDNGDVRYVTAHDVEYGIKRTLSPAEAVGDYVGVLYGHVLGGAEYFGCLDVEEGAEAPTEEEAAALLAAAVENVAVHALDDYTLEITAPFYLPFSPIIYGMWMARPQPQWVIEEFAEFWIEPENYVSYGPYAVKDWVHNDVVTLITNPFWAGTEDIPPAVIDELQLYFREQGVAMAMYEAGELDYMSDVPVADLDRVQSDPVLSEQFLMAPGDGSYYYGFSVGVEPFTNVHLRRAFSYAVDRDSIVDNVTRGGETPAQWFTTPSLAAAPTYDTHPDMGIWYDPDLAQEELQLYLDEMGYASVDDILDITLLYNTSDRHAAVAQAVQQMWVETLGIEVQLTNQEFHTYLDSRETFPVWRAGWGSDYPDTHNYLFDIFHSTGTTDTGWSHPDFDALVEEAMFLTDLDARRELYAQAEQMLVYEYAAVIPIYWQTKLNMTAPNVERTVALGGQEAFFEWDILNP